MTGKANLAASVAARLLHQARQTGSDYQTLLTSYCLERFLYRLAVSDRRDRFVLKGAMLLRLWSERPYRATLDLDFLRRGDSAFEAIREDLRAIIATAAPLDAVDFDGERIRMEAIRAEDEYAGTRATLPARCGKARLMLQIDMGLADAVWPAPRACVYPTLLDFPAFEVLAYPREAVVAEKLDCGAGGFCGRMRANARRVPLAAAGGSSAWPAAGRDVAPGRAVAMRALRLYPACSNGCARFRRTGDQAA